MTQDENLQKKVTLSEIQLCTPARRTPLRVRLVRHHYVQFQVDDTTRTTKPTKEKKNHTSWNETLYFDGNDDSVLIAKIYRKQRIGQDKLVASLKDTIGGVLGRVKNGVLEELLGKDISEITIKLTFTVEPHAGSSADELQATNAINRAIETTGALGGPISQVAGLAGSTTNTAANVVTELLSFENTWGILLQRMELFNKIVSGIAEVHPYTSLAWSVISAANQVLVNQKDRDERILRLAGAMKDVFAFVENAEPLKAVQAHREHVTLLVRQVTECGYFIAEYAKHGSFWLRTAQYTFSDIDTKITDYGNKLRDLKAAFLEGVNMQTGVIVFRMMNVMEFITESMDLKDIPYALSARYVQEKRCLPGTREGIIQEICDILNNPDETAPRLCLLTGVAGSGKSAVAHSIAQLYDEQERLGSSYCFLRSDVAKRNPQNLFSTIACDLSEKDPQYRSELYRVVENNRSLRNSASVSEQVKRFIIEPSKRLHAIGPLIVVVDALDESGDQSNRRDLLRAFSEHIADFPANLRFLITTRAESDILASLPPGPLIIHKQMSDIPQHIVDGDIQKFVRHSLRYHSELETAWPNEEWCRLLVYHSQRLFQWASTACKFIDGEGAIGLGIHERLEVLLQSNNGAGVHPLDELYRTILSQLFTLPQARHKFRDVMALVLALNEPLSLASLSSLFDGDSSIRDIIKPLGSLLDGVLNDQKPIRPLHTSFRDFLLDDARSSLFHVDLLPHHSLRIGRATLICMQQMLKFNLCDLKDSRLCNAAVPNLTPQVTKAIPTHLAYSCQYWMAHMCHVDCTPELLDDVTTFFKNHFPFWLEAISLLSLLSPVSYILGALKTCRTLNQWAQGHEIANLATEAVQFIQLFSPILRDSAPHLYLSAMPQTPSSSPLCQLWADHLQNYLSVPLGRPVNWPAEIHVLQGHTDNVLCVAYAPDGSHIVSGSQDYTIRIWDPITGQCVGGPFQLHTAPVVSVAYSPDSKYFVSGSRDGTIKTWDTTTGQCLGHPFLGHTQAISTVAYSPDGSCIASGSGDRTIRIWNANTGISAGAPFEGHNDTVSSLAYSSGGSQIVSGSHDTTVRVWSTKTGQCVAGPFKGHTSWIYSVAYSPSGCYVASASRDNNIHVWDLLTGEKVGNPFQEYTDWIFSIAYSPDGNHIASGSSDGTIMIWNASTGKCVAGPFQGHTSPVASITYSPDGNCIISGSWDNTVRIWNPNTGQQTASILQGHQNKITSISYSPDGNNIVSASFDKPFGFGMHILASVLQAL
ncbi:hypothetical protein JVU11DRAFT_8689 [Chiua virens]|nr:hypothetical protein JVU11DRAFT_8689 [Chiua virens]